MPTSLGGQTGSEVARGSLGAIIEQQKAATGEKMAEAAKETAEKRLPQWATGVIEGTKSLSSLVNAASNLWKTSYTKQVADAQANALASTSDSAKFELFTKMREEDAGIDKMVEQEFPNQSEKWAALKQGRREKLYWQRKADIDANPNKYRDGDFILSFLATRAGLNNDKYQALYKTEPESPALIKAAKSRALSTELEMLKTERALTYIKTLNYINPAAYLEIIKEFAPQLFEKGDVGVWKDIASAVGVQYSRDYKNLRPDQRIGLPQPGTGEFLQNTLGQPNGQSFADFIDSISRNRSIEDLKKGLSLKYPEEHIHAITRQAQRIAPHLAGNDKYENIEAMALRAHADGDQRTIALFNLIEQAAVNADGLPPGWEEQLEQVSKGQGTLQQVPPTVLASGGWKGVRGMVVKFKGFLPELLKSSLRAGMLLPPPTGGDPAGFNAGVRDLGIGVEFVGRGIEGIAAAATDKDKGNEPTDDEYDFAEGLAYSLMGLFDVGLSSGPEGAGKAMNQQVALWMQEVAGLNENQIDKAIGSLQRLAQGNHLWDREDISKEKRDQLNKMVAMACQNVLDQNAGKAGSAPLRPSTVRPVVEQGFLDDGYSWHQTEGWRTLDASLGDVADLMEGQWGVVPNEEGSLSLQRKAMPNVRYFLGDAPMTIQNLISDVAEGGKMWNGLYGAKSMGWNVDKLDEQAKAGGFNLASGAGIRLYTVSGGTPMSVQWSPEETGTKQQWETAAKADASKLRADLADRERGAAREHRYSPGFSPGGNITVTQMGQEPPKIGPRNREQSAAHMEDRAIETNKKIVNKAFDDGKSPENMTAQQQQDVVDDYAMATSSKLKELEEAMARGVSPAVIMDTADATRKLITDYAEFYRNAAIRTPSSHIGRIVDGRLFGHDPVRAMTQFESIMASMQQTPGTDITDHPDFDKKMGTGLTQPAFGGDEEHPDLDIGAEDPDSTILRGLMERSRWLNPTGAKQVKGPMTQVRQQPPAPAAPKEPAVNNPEGAGWKPGDLQYHGTGGDVLGFADFIDWNFAERTAAEGTGGFLPMPTEGQQSELRGDWMNNLVQEMVTSSPGEKNYEEALRFFVQENYPGQVGQSGPHRAFWQEVLNNRGRDPGMEPSIPNTSAWNKWKLDMDAYNKWQAIMSLIDSKRRQ